MQRSLVLRGRSLPALVISALALLMSAAPLHAALIVGSDTLQGNAYTTYQEVGETTFRFVCKAPCPIPLATLQAASDGFRAVKPELLAFAGLDTLPAVRPVDIAFETNSICPRVGNAAAYAGLYQPYGFGPGQPRRGKVCLFLWDYQQAGQIDYFTPAAAGLRSSQTLIVHEYAHIIFAARFHYGGEDFVRYWSYMIGGGVPLPQGMCSQNLVTYRGAMVYELCQRFGADDSDLAFAVAGLDNVYQSNQGYHAGEASMAQLRMILDQRFGTYTGDMFLDLGYGPQHVGGVFHGTPSPPTGHYFDTGLPGDTFRLRGNSFQDSAIKLEQPSCYAELPSLHRDVMLHLVKPDHRERVNILDEPVFGTHMQVTYSFAHWTPPASINPRNLHVYRMVGNCEQPSPAMAWFPLPDNWIDFDHELRTVRFLTPVGGTYALVQHEKLLGSGFEQGPTTGTYPIRQLFLNNVHDDHYEENFDQVANGMATSLNFSGNGFAYTVSANGGNLYNSNGRISVFNSHASIVVTFTGAPVTAVGGNFWATNHSSQPNGSSIVISLSNNTQHTIDSTNADSFAGLITSTPITSITVTAPSTGTQTWPTMDNLIVGRRR